MITNTIASNMINYDNDSGSNNIKGVGAHLENSQTNKLLKAPPRKGKQQKLQTKRRLHNSLKNRPAGARGGPHEDRCVAGPKRVEHCAVLIRVFRPLGVGPSVPGQSAAAGAGVVMATPPPIAAIPSDVIAGTSPSDSITSTSISRPCFLFIEPE
jgi:hypothetical protein